MITREELRSIPVLNRQIEADKKRLYFLREKAVSLPSTLPDHERVQTSPSGGGNRYVEEAVDLAKEISEKEAELKKLRGEARAFIRSLPVETETEKLTRKVLTRRYLRGYTWPEIADSLVYSVRYLQQLEWDAIKNL